MCLWGDRQQTMNRRTKREGAQYLLDKYVLYKVKVKVAQSCPTLCDSMDCSPPGSSVHGLLQARILWVAMLSSKGSSQPRDQTHISYVSCIGRWVLYHQWHQGSTGGPNKCTDFMFSPALKYKFYFITLKVLLFLNFQSI